VDVPPLNAPLRHAKAVATGQHITLDAEEARGLRFRQINPKEAFTLIDAEGRFFRASLGSLDERGGSAQVFEAMPHSTESGARLTLFCAVLARQRMLGVVQKATELGVVRVVPVITERSVQQSGLTHEKAHAWPGQALRAARQCRRASVPEVRAAVDFAAAVDDAAFVTAHARFYLDDRGALGGTVSATGFAGVAPDGSALSDIALFVGPEGGFSDGERRLLDTRRAEAVRLGGRVLRAETAVLVGLSLLQQAFGDLR
jgi:16S rRNA (uracil1498-N3)-methyltransferase